jgi:hypothetical protein
MATYWKSDWVNGDFVIAIDGRTKEMAYRIGNRIQIGDHLIVSPPNQRYEVTGTRGEKQLWDDKDGTGDAVASVVHRKRLGGEQLKIEAGEAVFMLDIATNRQPRVEFFAPKISVSDVNAVMVDVTGAQVLEIDRKYRKERIKYRLLGRQMEGRLEGAMRAIHPVPTPAVLLALHLTLRPEKLLQIGRFHESGTIGG